MTWIQKNGIMRYEEQEDILVKLAKINGIKDLTEWLKPSSKSLHDPYLLDNIDEACDRIIQAIDNDEKITIFYDIDADGVCSGTMMYKYLSNFTNNLKTLYMQRSDGHGIESYTEEIDTDLLIIVDSSTNSIKKCRELKNKGIDIVVIDHHEQEKQNPYVTLVNNNACRYPNKELSGAGVVYKVLQVLDEKMNESLAFDYIDLAGLGIYGDVMSVLEPENRYFIYHSLKNINNMGLNALVKANNALLGMNAETYGFKIVPLINASARMNKIETVIQLLLSDNPDECKKLAKECVKLNDTRKDIQADVYESIKQKIQDDKKIIIVVTEESNKGFNGLIATQIVAEYKKPCLVVKLTDGYCEGSARAYGGFNLKAFLEKSKLFVFTTGHAGSFGVKFAEENLDKIYEYAEKNLDKAKVKAEDIYYDLEIDIADITDEFMNKVTWFNYITGKGFPATKFVIRDLFIKKRELLGKGIIKETVKMTADNDLLLMKFKTTEDYAEDAELCKIDVIGTLNLNKWYHFGKKEVITNNQMYMEDWRFSE